MHCFKNNTHAIYISSSAVSKLINLKEFLNINYEYCSFNADREQNESVVADILHSNSETTPEGSSVACRETTLCPSIREHLLLY